MVKTPRWFLLVCLALLCLGADRAESALRRGYAAWLRGDLESAMAAYEQAMSVSSDPGRVAASLGAIQAQAGRYAEAARSFTQSLEDAQGLRRCRAAYGQATSLTHLAQALPGRRAVALLRQALQSYDLAIREAASPGDAEAASVQADAAYNRSLAEALLAQKLKEPETLEEEAKTDEELIEDALADSSRGDNASPARNATVDSGKEGSAANHSKAAPGRGNLPPLPDDDQPPAISEAEARERLQQLMQRLRQPFRTTPTPAGSKDW